MTIAVLHNYYQYRGGEDAVFEAEAALLEARGHNAARFSLHNDAVRGRSGAWLAAATLWNGETYRQTLDFFRRERPQVAHVHNTLPLLSPSVYYAAARAGVPVVQTLHNYRLLCPNALFYREGRACEDCLGKTFALPAVRHKCYRQSRSASALVAGMTAAHRAAGTWRERVSLYVALTEFARQKFIEGGLPADKIVVKPNFVERDAGEGTGEGFAGRRFALFVGRLSPEKGVRTLLRAWEHIPDGLDLVVVGDGPLEDEVRAFAASKGLQNVRFTGKKPLDEAMELMKAARCLVFPSELYETFGKSMIEAFACGTPVVCSRLGAMREVVSDGKTGFHCEPGDAEALAAAIGKIQALGAEAYAAMRRSARAEYEARYAAARNAEMLEAIYERVIRT